MAAWMQRYFAGLSRNTFLLALSSLFADISTEMLYPVLPVFLTQVLHASGSIVGLVDGFAQATQNIVQGFSGAVSDHLQKRKPVALVGYLLAALAKPESLFGMSPDWTSLDAAEKDAVIIEVRQMAGEGRFLPIPSTALIAVAQR